jgi:hypothetical protein
MRHGRERKGVAADGVGAEGAVVVGSMVGFNEWCVVDRKQQW